MNLHGTGNLENSEALSVLGDVLHELKKDMVYDLYGNNFYVEETVARMDLMAFLSERYQVHPGIGLDMFAKLKQEIIEAWNEDAPEWTERFEVISATLDKLEAQIRLFNTR